MLTVVAALLAACSGAPLTPTVAPTKTPLPTFTPVPPSPTETPTPVATSTPTPVPPTPTATPIPNVNPLTGLSLGQASRLQRRPLQVVVNNSPVARPQYGLAEADIVWEYVMDGWAVTRFTAIYLSQEVERIGPVRSARLINLNLGPMFDAALVASGASVDVRWLLRNKGNFPYFDIDLDDPGNNVYSISLGTYWETRLQTSTQGLRQWLQKSGLEQPVDLKPFDFSVTVPITGSAPGTSLHIPYPESSVVDWAFDAGSAAYLRSAMGEAHVDGATGKQLTAANVVVLYAPHGKTAIVEDSLGNTAIQINLAGEGKALVLRDGQSWEGKWRWDAPVDAATIGTGDTVAVPRQTGKLPQFVTADGQPIPLKPGATWFQVVPDDYKVGVK